MFNVDVLSNKNELKNTRKITGIYIKQSWSVHYRESTMSQARVKHESMKHSSAVTTNYKSTCIVQVSVVSKEEKKKKTEKMCTCHEATWPIITMSQGMKGPTLETFQSTVLSALEFDLNSPLNWATWCLILRQTQMTEVASLKQMKKLDTDDTHPRPYPTTQFTPQLVSLNN